MLDIILDDKQRRCLRMGLETMSGWAKKGFFIPYRYADTVAEPGNLPMYGAVDRVFEDHRSQFLHMLAMIDQTAEALNGIGDCQEPPNPRWDQDWFPGLDAAMAYSLVYQQQPARIIEVGSGHSTRFMAAAARPRTDVVCIDPAPRAALKNLPVIWHQDVISENHLPLFDKLQPGDVCFIDSSHILMPGTDVDFLFNRVLPRLNSGVLVHIHDILLPFDYPAAWGWRRYNEQQAVAGMVTGGGYKPLFSSAWARRRMVDDLQKSIVATLPLKDGALETSLWLEKTAPAIRAE